MAFKKLFTLTFILMMVLGLSGCKKDGRGDAPPEYALNDVVFPALSAVLEDEDWTFTDLNASEEEESDSSADSSSADSSADSAAATQPEFLHYRYENLPSAAQAVETYLTTLTAEHSFLVVDEAGSTTDFPDFSLEEGSALMSRINLETHRLIRLHLSWDATSCNVEITLPDTSSTAATPAQEDALPKQEPLSAREAIDFLAALSPSALELEGASMSQYNIYLVDGQAFVDGIACLRMRVYLTETQGFNSFLGSYLLSGDKQHLYRVDSATNEVHELSLH